MTVLAKLGKTLSAIATGAVCGAIAYFALSYFSPPEPPEKISFVAFVGGLFGCAVGVYTGWRWAQNIAESIAGEILEKIILGGIALVVRAF